MKILISSLINDFDRMEEIALWIDSLKDPNLGIELIAFTHDEHYWERLEAILGVISCPVSFHGPYIDVEATSELDSKEYKFFLDSYRKVASLANKYNAEHIVYHYSQLGFNSKELLKKKEISEISISNIINLQNEYNVPILIENLAFVKNTLPIYNNEEYKEIFTRVENSKSIIDVGHANINKLDLREFLEKNAESVKAYHFHNNDGLKDSHDRIKNGSIDYKEIMKLYNEFTPNANIVIEYEPHTNCSKQDILDDIQYIRENLK